MGHCSIPSSAASGSRVADCSDLALLLSLLYCSSSPHSSGTALSRGSRFGQWLLERWSTQRGAFFVARLLGQHSLSHLVACTAAARSMDFEAP